MYFDTKVPTYQWQLLPPLQGTLKLEVGSSSNTVAHDVTPIKTLIILVTMLRTLDFTHHIWLPNTKTAMDVVFYASHMVS
jgi:hypothetical protein